MSLSRLLKQAREEDLESLRLLQKALERKLGGLAPDEIEFRPWNVPSCFNFRGMRRQQIKVAYDVDWNRKAKEETWSVGAVARRDFDSYVMWVAITEDQKPLVDDGYIRHFGTRQEAAKALIEAFETGERHGHSD